MSLGRRSFFTAIGAAVAAVKVAPAEAAFPSDACVLCGFDHDLKSWGNVVGPVVMRCADKGGCQARQINALLGDRTLWQERTGVVMAKGERR
jgi:hypothetical protein